MIKKIKYSISDLQNSSDENLISLIFEKAVEFEFQTFGENFEKTDLSFSDFFALWTLKLEVENGGFDQFFKNNGLEYGEKALRGSNRIGANEYSKVISEAINIYKSQKVEFESKRNTEFNEIDDMFYDLVDLEVFQIKYVRGNYEKFIVE
jgi:hypothetical protein